MNKDELHALSDVGINDLVRMDDGVDKAVGLLWYGVDWDGGHHKQWFIVEALKALGVKIEDLEAILEDLEGYEGYQVDRGIAP